MRKVRGVYHPAVTAYYEDHLQRGSTPDGSRGGASIMKAFASNGCIKDKRLELTSDVRQYDMCERVYKCVEN